MTDADAAVLEFERTRSHGPDDEDAMRSGFGSVVRYYQRLGRLLDDPAALAADPELIYRLRRQRDTRAMNRRRRHL